MVEEDWKDYLKRMSDSKEWGDHPILVAAAHYLNRYIVVVSSVQKETPIIIPELIMDSESDDKPSIMLGHEHELHYVSVVPSKLQDSYKLVPYSYHTLVLSVATSNVFCNMQSFNLSISYHDLNIVNKQ